jgi:hypothetical protein
MRKKLTNYIIRLWAGTKVPRWDFWNVGQRGRRFRLSGGFFVVPFNRGRYRLRHGLLPAWMFER